MLVIIGATPEGKKELIGFQVGLRENTQRRLVAKNRKLMVFTLIQAASKKCLRLKRRNQLPKVIEGIRFTDGIDDTHDTKNRAPDDARHPNSNLAPATATTDWISWRLDTTMQSLKDLTLFVRRTSLDTVFTKNKRPAAHASSSASQ